MLPDENGALISCESIITANRYFHLDDKILIDLLRATLTLMGIEKFSPLLKRFHDLFFHTDMDTDHVAGLWKQEGAVLGDLQASASAILIITGILHLLNLYHERNIPDFILCDSIKDMGIWIDDNIQKTGRTGLEEVSWLLRTIRGLVFRLGRLQFIYKPVSLNIEVVVRNSDRTAVAFFPQSENIREDGQINGSNNICSPNLFESFFSNNGDIIEGTPIHPKGNVLPYNIRLLKNEWYTSILPNTGSLAIHVPKDGKLDFEQCRESLVSASSFYPSYFPDKPFKVFTLYTWFLDAQLQYLLPADSNIVRFQKEFYLFPVLSDDHASNERIFGDAFIDIKNAPEDTSLRRTVKRFMLAGGRMRCSAGFILKSDLDFFGTERYQTVSAEYIDYCKRERTSSIQL